MSKKNSDFKPYIPADRVVPEFTVTSVLIGIILAIVFGAANAYLGLKVGMTISASIPAAVISMAIIRVILRRDSILENNLVQTIGSAGESVAAGAIFTLPALFLWAKEGVISMPSVVTLGLVALVGGVLGVIFMVPLRQALIVEEHGGIYFDTDVEAVRSFDELLDNPAFFGFENDRFVNTGEGFGAEPHNPAVRQMLAEYDPLLDGQHGTIGCPRLNTDALLKLGLELNGEKQKLIGAVVFPEDYLNPRSSVTGELRKTENTHSIHWYSASWMPWHKRLRSAISKPVHFILGRAKGRGR